MSVYDMENDNLSLHLTVTEQLYRVDQQFWTRETSADW